MPKIEKAERREKKRQKRNEMVRRGDSVKIIRDLIVRRGKEASGGREDRNG